MDIKLEQIGKIIKSQLKSFEDQVEYSDTGTIVVVGDGIVKAH